MFGIFKRLKRRKLRQALFPEAWYGYLDEKVPFYKTMPDAEKARFLEYLKVFVLEKHFIGAQGLEVTEEMKVIVAAAAVRLVHHMDLSFYDRLTEIILYPFDYKHPEKEGMILGEAHSWGTVVLSWPAVVRGPQDPRDGHDTATHEFAHVLDRKSGAFNGTPQLRAHEDYRPWAQVMEQHYLKLRKGGRRRRKVLREYGATNEAEFFAVATEAFFEKSAQMRREKPELYAELKRFYGWDPAEH